MKTLILIISILLIIWTIISLIDFFINYINLHKWNIIEVLWNNLFKYF